MTNSYVMNSVENYFGSWWLMIWEDPDQHTLEQSHLHKEEDNIELRCWVGGGLLISTQASIPYTEIGWEPSILFLLLHLKRGILWHNSKQKSSASAGSEIFKLRVG